MKCKICLCDLDEEQKSGYVGIAGKIQPVETIKIIIGSGLMIYYPMVYKVTPKELQGKKDEYVIVDVRETDELEEGKIDGAVNIPLGQLIRKARQCDLNDLKRKKICTYCSGGYRGNIAADELNKQGFDAVTIEGGYSAWKDGEKTKRKDNDSNE
jgi:rhodanese-related sulfurtransferase